MTSRLFRSPIGAGARVRARVATRVIAAAVAVALAPVLPVGTAGPAVAAGRAVAVAHTGGIPLNLRSGASLGHARVATVPNGRRLAVLCQVRGQAVAGHARRTDVWLRLRGGRYASEANVAWRPVRRAPRSCGRATSTAPARHTATVATGGIPLNLRAGPSTAHRRVGTVADGARVAVVCQVPGQAITGHLRRTGRWVRLAGGQHASDAYLTWPPGRSRLPGCAAVPMAPVGRPDAVAADPAAFIARLAAPARASMRRHGVPASVTIAQAILESGWGRSELAYADHNYFGIKCFGEPGPVAVGCRSYGTSECADDRCFATRATFRVYRSLADSVRDHGRFLAVDNPRYRPAFVHRRSADRFTVAIHRAGYATSPGYARAVIGLMRQYALYRYDA
jgi:flagellar protein FlgJ